MTFCKAKKSFRSITEVAAEILIDRKRLYDIANIFQELDIISKYEDTFYFNSSDKIIPLVGNLQMLDGDDNNTSVHPFFSTL